MSTWPAPQSIDYTLLIAARLDQAESGYAEELPYRHRSSHVENHVHPATSGLQTHGPPQSRSTGFIDSLDVEHSA